jgi:hypothetical protein
MSPNVIADAVVQLCAQPAGANTDLLVLRSSSAR